MIDYVNPSPAALKKWEKEYRNKCWREIRQYLKNFPDATQEEKRDLSRWVRSGHSPYENGAYVATDSGGPMDFINAQRFLEEVHQKYLKNPEAYRGSYELTESASDDSDLNDDLPF